MLAIGLSYARKMTDQFSFGATVRYAEETLDMLKMRSFMVDLGHVLLDRPRHRAVRRRDHEFRRRRQAGRDGDADGRRDGDSTFQSFSLPDASSSSALRSNRCMTDEHRVTTSVQLNHPNDNAENVRIGVEYAWQNTFFLRGGLKRTIGQKLLARG